MDYLGETKRGLQKPPRSGLVLQSEFNKPARQVTPKICQLRKHHNTKLPFTLLSA
jgi:hypothetical protein